MKKQIKEMLKLQSASQTNMLPTQKGFDKGF